MGKSLKVVRHRNQATKIVPALPASAPIQNADMNVSPPSSANTSAAMIFGSHKAALPPGLPIFRAGSHGGGDARIVNPNGSHLGYVHLDCRTFCQRAGLERWTPQA